MKPLQIQSSVFSLKDLIIGLKSFGLKRSLSSDLRDLSLQTKGSSFWFPFMNISQVSESWVTRQKDCNSFFCECYKCRCHLQSVTTAIAFETNSKTDQSEIHNDSAPKIYYWHFFIYKDKSNIQKRLLFLRYRSASPSWSP